MSKEKEIKQSDIWATIEKHIDPVGANAEGKIPNILKMFTKFPATPMMQRPSRNTAGTMVNPSAMRNTYEDAIQENVKPEPIDPNLFNFHGRG